MDYENSERRNQIAMDSRKQTEAPTGTSYEQMAGRGARDGGISRLSIRQRIDDARRQADHAIRRAEAAEHARQIIERHPELADLLDALNEF